MDCEIQLTCPKRRIESDHSNMCRFAEWNADCTDIASDRSGLVNEHVWFGVCECELKSDYVSLYVMLHCFIDAEISIQLCHRLFRNYIHCERVNVRNCAADSWYQCNSFELSIKSMESMDEYILCVDVYVYVYVYVCCDHVIELTAENSSSTAKPMNYTFHIRNDPSANLWHWHSSLSPHSFQIQSSNCIYFYSLHLLNQLSLDVSLHLSTNETWKNTNRDDDDDCVFIFN